ncbi:MAG: hypothetical protein GWO08_16595 [Gammaproteobacteria bacterium]|nr:hypothetical protein [Gammaproteobacteria bacterium]
MHLVKQEDAKAVSWTHRGNSQPRPGSWKSHRQIVYRRNRHRVKRELKYMAERNIVDKHIEHVKANEITDWWLC